MCVVGGPTQSYPGSGGWGPRPSDCSLRCRWLIGAALDEMRVCPSRQGSSRWKQQGARSVACRSDFKTSLVFVVVLRFLTPIEDQSSSLALIVSLCPGKYVKCHYRRFCSAYM